MITRSTRFLGFLAFLLALVATGSLGAQAYAHFDRPYHASGEVSYFKLYLPQPAPATVRVGVYSPEGEALDYFFLRTSGGSAEGVYRWPYTLATGTYRLAVAALTANEVDLTLGIFEHPVYNDRDYQQEAVDGDLGSIGVPGMGLSVSHEEDRLSISGVAGAEYSVAVYNLEVLGERGGVTASSITYNSASAYLDTLYYTGTLSDGTSVNLLPFFDNATLDSYFSKTDDGGRFVLTVPGFEGEKTVQARSISEQDFRAEIDLPELPTITRTPPVTDDVLGYLDLSRRRRKIYQLYQTVETALELNAERPERSKKVIDKRYPVQDYKAFPDMYTFFKEVAGELRMRERRDAYTAVLYNAPNQRFFQRTPLYIVNGMLTRDNDYVAKISPANVEYLGYSYDNPSLRRDFPALGSQGVVLIDLLRPDPNFPEADAANILSVKGLQPEPDYGERPEEVPLLSPLLLWQTGSSESASQSIRLPRTDDSGTYVAVVTSWRDGDIAVTTTTFTLGGE